MFNAHRRIKAKNCGATVALIIMHQHNLAKKNPLTWVLQKTYSDWREASHYNDVYFLFILPLFQLWGRETVSPLSRGSYRLPNSHLVFVHSYFPSPHHSISFSVFSHPLSYNCISIIPSHHMTHRNLHSHIMSLRIDSPLTLSS